MGIGFFYHSPYRFLFIQDLTEYSVSPTLDLSFKGLPQVYGLLVRLLLGEHLGYLWKL
jgi:hypothetical protein